MTKVKTRREQDEDTFNAWIDSQLTQWLRFSKVFKLLDRMELKAIEEGKEEPVDAEFEEIVETESLTKEGVPRKDA